MKKFLLTLVLLFLTTPVFAANLIAAKFHADWCSTCQTMGPVYSEALGAYGDQLKIVKFDKTDEATSAASLELAKQHGIEEVYSAHEKTGMVLLIDGDNKKVLGKLSKTQTPADMAMVINGALSGNDMMKATDAGKGSAMEKKGSPAPKAKGSKKGSGY